MKCERSAGSTSSPRAKRDASAGSVGEPLNGGASGGAGRARGRHQALETWRGREVVEALGRRGILIRGVTRRGVAEEAPGAYKDVDRVVAAAHRAGLARKVARLSPRVCVKG